MRGNNVPLLLPLALSACATPRLYTEAELGTLAQSCGYSLGEVAQDAEQKRLLLVLSPADAPPAAQSCVYRWAHPRHLHVVYVQVALPPTPPTPTEQ